MTNKSIIVTITGPSGSGKTVLSNLLNKQGFKTLVSSTTRVARKGEIDGVDYHFLKKDDFIKKLDNGEFIENVEYNDTLYGISSVEAKNCFNSGKCAVLVAEPHGVVQIDEYAQKEGWRVVKVFIDNPKELLLERLLNRLSLDIGLDKFFNNEDKDGFNKNTLTPWINEIKKTLGDNKDTQDQYKKNKYKVVLVNFLNAVSNNSLIKDNFNTNTLLQDRLNAAALRLSSFQFEQDNWVKQIKENPEMYDIVVPLFNKDVQNKVINNITNKVNNLSYKKDKKNIFKP